MLRSDISLRAFLRGDLPSLVHASVSGDRQPSRRLRTNSACAHWLASASQLLQRRRYRVGELHIILLVHVVPDTPVLWRQFVEALALAPDRIVRRSMQSYGALAHRRPPGGRWPPSLGQTLHPHSRLRRRRQVAPKWASESGWRCRDPGSKGNSWPFQA